MNDTATPTPETHGPPRATAGGMPVGVPLDDDAVIVPRELAPIAETERTVEHRRVATASDRYLLLAQRLRDDPMNVLRRMLMGEYRYKRRRNGQLWLDRDQPVMEVMSLRQAAVELERLTGENVTYETLRRWWLRIWPLTPIPDGSTPAEPPAPEPPAAPGVPGLIFMPPEPLDDTP
jgi:hypothetical protein